jgi:2-C-methyl-D-erythritol 2,4-cyclodiphosphate synthase
VTEPRVGLGFDVHPSDPGRPLRLGCVAFEGEAGLAGHSDGDVVCHALADALLGAAGLGDIGEHFPETDPAVEGIAGPDLLARTAAMVRDSGYVLSSVDIVVVAERPAVAPRRGEIRPALADALGIDPERVSVKASRPEGLGLSGDGIGCLAVAVLVRA